MNLPLKTTTHPRLVPRPSLAARDEWEDTQTDVWSHGEPDTEVDVPVFAPAARRRASSESVSFRNPSPLPPLTFATPPAPARVPIATPAPAPVVSVSRAPSFEALSWTAPGELHRPRAVTAIEPPRSRAPATDRRWLLSLAAAAAVAAGIGAAAGQRLYQGRSPVPRQIASIDTPWREPDDGSPLERVEVAGEESSRALHPLSAPYRDLWRSSVWYHPLTGETLLPGRAQRKFGAKRQGHRPSECMRGHCGVDLGSFGLTVRAAQDGVVERVQRRPHDNAGKYVRIGHPDGFVSYYIHLHTIRDDLRVGMHVSGGEPIGIVGRSGIKRAAPHLHFAITYRDGDQHYFVDPEPMLRRAITSPSTDDLAGTELLAGTSVRPTRDATR